MDYRTLVAWDTGLQAPTAIIDAAPATDADLLRVADYVEAASLPAANRVLWQDAAAARAGYGIYTDLTSDGSVRVDYVPLACGGAPVNCVTNPPSQTGIANNRRTQHEFDGLARASRTIAFIATGASPAQVITRQGTKAGAKVDNYIDPLTSGQVAWTQSADQYFMSMKEVGQEDAYRTFYEYDADGNQVAVAAPAWNQRPTYSGTVTGTLHNASLLAGYWRLGETSGTTAADASGGGHSGTYSGSPTLNQADGLVGDSNPAVAFDGVNDQVTWTNALGTINGAYTVSVWAKPEHPTNTMTVIGSRTGGDYGFALKFSGGNSIQANIGNGSVWLASAATVTYPYLVNRWYHLSFVVTTAGWWGYVNGELAGRGTFSTGTPLLTDSTRLLRVGTTGNAGDPEWFDGWIDEPAVWSQGLTGPQVRNLFLAGRSLAQMTARTIRDDEGHAIQTDDQFLASPGFEGGTDVWDLSATAGGSLYAATSESDGNVRQPLDPEAPPSWFSFQTGATGSARQDVTLLPGQTFRFQVYEKRAGSQGGANIIVRYWKRSNSTWVDLLNDSPVSRVVGRPCLGHHPTA